MKLLVILFFSLQILLHCHADAYQSLIEGTFYNDYNKALLEIKKNKDSTVEGIGKLTTSLLHDLYIRVGKNHNIIFSPFSIWVVLAILFEGADGKTEKELKAKLNVLHSNHEEGKNIIRSRYQKIKKYYQDSSIPTEFSSLNFAISNERLGIDFQKTFIHYYGGKYFKFSNKKKNLFSIMVNSWALDKSNGKITSIISPNMLNDLTLLIGNAVYFKSKWKIPFDQNDTKLSPFKDEFGKVTGNTLMMQILTTLPLGYNQELGLQLVEIPYADNMTSMIVMLPKPEVPLKTVLTKMKHRSLGQIISQNMIEETVYLSLPRFHVYSNIYLNDILKKDLPSMFDQIKAEFPQMGQNIYVSKIFHKAKIENTEEGTITSAVSSVQFAYKTLSSVFQANRPFIYFINDIKSRTILFSGTFTKPESENLKIN